MAGSEVTQWRSGEHRTMGAAAAHPLRQAVASRLRRDGSGGAASLAAALDEDRARIEYQLRVLARAGLAAVLPRQRAARPAYRLRDGQPWFGELLDGVEE